MKFLSILILMLSTQAFSKILPDNDLWKEDGKYRSLTDMTEERFLELADEAIEAFKPYAAIHGKVLTLDPLWDSTEVNAYAYPTANEMMVEMHGGLARRPEVTEDGFQLVVCHEIGHHLAGFAKYGPNDWAATEGQSDYYASQVCAKEIWKEDIAHNAMYETIAPDSLKGDCNEVYSSDEERHLCYRIGMAGHSLATLLAFGDNVDFDTRDQNVVDSTYPSHPEGQCRLDTYVAGGLCDVEFNKEEIPQTEEEARPTSCMRVDGYNLEARPRCWFAPSSSNQDDFSAYGVKRAEGIYAIGFKNIPPAGESIELYWGEGSWYPFVTIPVEGDSFETDSAWGLGTDKNIRVELWSDEGFLLYSKVITLD